MIIVLGVLAYLTVAAVVWRKVFVRCWDDPLTQERRDTHYGYRKQDIALQAFFFAIAWPFALSGYGMILLTRRFILAPTPRERATIAEKEYREALQAVKEYEKENAL